MPFKERKYLFKHFQIGETKVLEPGDFLFAETIVKKDRQGNPVFVEGFKNTGIVDNNTLRVETRKLRGGRPVTTKVEIYHNDGTNVILEQQDSRIGSFMTVRRRWESS